MSRIGGTSPVSRPHGAGGTAPIDPGRFSLRPLDPRTDSALVHRWVTHPKSAFWMMRHFDLGDIEEKYTAMAAHEHHDAFLGLVDGVPAFLIERYDPRYVALVGLYRPEPGDVGLHFLVSPADRPVHGFTRAAITSTMRMLFADPATRRVVAEPDIRNDAAHTIFAYAGFTTTEKIRKPEKDAYLCVCPRERFEQSPAGRSVAP
ncbi:GNAT family N-acetyltransferase [Streptomyces sp. NPDC000594]|uniref:GNAT family N-acetyltransferase n=1 Tax=Streptomyces sp. NPDC000594 TaxID=3154261 RepID=UPI00331A9A38